MTRATPITLPDDETERGEAEKAFRPREAGAPPATAEQFRITDPQHWIDLSA